MQKKNILILTHSPEGATGKLFSTLRDALERHGLNVVFNSRPEKSGYGYKIYSIFKSLPEAYWRVKKADIVIAHSVLTMSFPYIVFSFFLKKKMISFVWDIYPSDKIEPSLLKFFSNSIFRKTEFLCYRLSTKVLVPSLDYIEPRLKGLEDCIEVVRIWPSSDKDVLNSSENVDSGSSINDVSEIKIVFMGQIHPTRGLGSSIEKILSKFELDIELNIYTSSAIPAGIVDMVARNPRLKLVNHGFVDRHTLEEELCDYDFGLVCLSHDFMMPAYPSKLVNYVSLGLPVIYDGPHYDALVSDIVNFGLGVCIDDWDGGEAFDFLAFDKNRKAYLDVCDIYSSKNIDLILS